MKLQGTHNGRPRKAPFCQPEVVRRAERGVSPGTPRHLTALSGLLITQGALRPFEQETSLYMQLLSQELTGCLESSQGCEAAGILSPTQHTASVRQDSKLNLPHQWLMVTLILERHTAPSPPVARAPDLTAGPALLRLSTQIYAENPTQVCFLLQITKLAFGLSNCFSARKTAASLREILSNN